MICSGRRSQLQTTYDVYKYNVLDLLAPVKPAKQRHGGHDCLDGTAAEISISIVVKDHANVELRRQKHTRTMVKAMGTTLFVLSRSTSYKPHLYSSC